MQHLTPPIDAFTLIEAPAATDRVIAASRVEANVRLRYRVAQALVQGRVEFHYQPVVSAAERLPIGPLPVLVKVKVWAAGALL